jgi:gamma-glutamyltranspeptidase
MAEPYSIIKDVEKSLKSKGHIITPYKWNKIGEMNAILINEKGYLGAADTRGENTAVGY